MRLTRPGQVFLAATALAFAGVAAGPATASSDSGSASTSTTTKQRPPTPSWEEYKAAAFKDADGQYIVNGDEAVSDLAELRSYYNRMIEHTDGGQPAGLIVNQDGGGDDLWSASQAGNLTYCVSTAFGSDYNAIVSAMAQGASLWEGSSSGIDFVHVSSADSNCRTSNNAVLFSVEPTSTTQYIARAFFPSSADYERNVLVNADSLQSSGSWTPGNIMGHELGHTLGFRHEHTRPEAGTCFEDNNWRPLTPYDSVSIMHYPQCNGGSDDLTFSGYDAQGVKTVYGG